MKNVIQGYCEHPSCGKFAVLREQPLNRSTATAMLCYPCADKEQKEVDNAWQEYYSGCL